MGIAATYGNNAMYVNIPHVRKKYASIPQKISAQLQPHPTPDNPKR